MKSIFSLLVVAMLFTFIACSKSKSETENQSAPQDPTQVVQLEVVGMTCTGCEVTVKKALTKIDGVYEAKASYQTNSAEVTIDPTKVDEQKLIEAVNQTGYKASRKPS